jgi:hypothetical protein
MELTVRDRQSLWDIAVQYLGGVEGVFLLAARNGIEVTSRLKDGQRLEWENDDVISPSIQSACTVKGIIPATDIDEQDYKELLAATSTKAATAIAAVKEQPEQAEEDTIVIDKITEVIKDLQEGKPVESDGGQALTRIFEDEFDTVFA